MPATTTPALFHKEADIVRELTATAGAERAGLDNDLEKDDDGRREPLPTIRFSETVLCSCDGLPVEEDRLSEEYARDLTELGLPPAETTMSSVKRNYPSGPASMASTTRSNRESSQCLRKRRPARVTPAQRTFATSVTAGVGGAHHEAMMSRMSKPAMPALCARRML